MSSLIRIPDYYNPVIGEMYHIRGGIYRCEENPNRLRCSGCFFSRTQCEYRGKCMPESREDKKHVIFVPVLTRQPKIGSVATCKGCGMEFKVSSPNNLYCSTKCRIKTNNMTFKIIRENTKFVKKCLICGKEFRTASYNANYCSAQCVLKHNTAMLDNGTCVICGSTFVKRNSMQKCCSPACSSVLNKQIKKAYYIRKKNRAEK